MITMTHHETTLDDKLYSNNLLNTNIHYLCQDITYTLNNN